MPNFYIIIESEVLYNCQIVFGGGRRNFIPKSQKDEQGHPGHRSDGENLISKWLLKKKSLGDTPYYIYDRKVATSWTCFSEECGLKA